MVENTTENIILDNLKEFPGNSNKLEYDLRELLLIKLISILEQYLIDNIKFIFIESKEPFKTNNTIEFQHQELLSFKSLTDVFNKIISKECRQLSSRGFNEIIKYYKSKFKLNLDLYCPSKDRILEYHDRRHLHVHNLGKTDKQYRKKYNTTKLGISITDEYIRNAIQDISVFAEIVNKNTLNYIENLKTIKVQKINVRNHNQKLTNYSRPI
jgi:hypothetical protein